jgi:hypothetical protein
VVGIAIKVEENRKKQCFFLFSCRPSAVLGGALVSTGDPFVSNEKIMLKRKLLA